jgi:sirohydrochlorin ferrochelatase
MNRIAFLGAAAAALIALPASAQSIHISTIGKSPAQVRAEVHKAATRLCEQQADGSTIWVDEMRACVDNTTRDTLAQSNDPNLRFSQR